MTAQALAHLLSQLDPVSNRRKGDQFERICKWFLENDPLYKARFRQVWHFTEWPQRWSNVDLGTDLIAEDHDGEFWAIQAKAYGKTSDVNHTDMGTFLADSNRTVISHRMLIATTEGLGRNAASVFAGQTDKPVVQVMRSRLEAAQVNWPESLADLREPRPPVPPRRPEGNWAYQGEAMDAVVEGLHSADRGQLIMACGTGKTLTALFIKEKLGADRTLVLLPSISLLSQTLVEWTANATTPFEYLPVCSDETVGESDDVIVMDVRDVGDRVTTDPAKIAGFLRQPGPRVVFSTYQSSPQIAEALEMGRVAPFDLVVADEAHRTTGTGSTPFSTVLDDQKLPARRRLFMTATPRYFTGSVVREAAALDYEVATMNNVAQYGPVFHRLSFGQAIARELLTDYQVAVIAVNEAEYRKMAEKATWVRAENGLNARSYLLAAQIALAKGMRDHDLKRVISFHRLVDNARRFAHQFSEVVNWMPATERPTGQIWAHHVNGKMTAKERGKYLDELRDLDADQRGLLSNARCLTEGVDVPALDGVIFVDPKNSEVDIVQAVGRAIRRSPDKKQGTIIIPVFMSDDEDFEAVLADSTFKTVWWVVKALRLHDEELAEQLDNLRVGTGRPEGGAPRLPDNIHFSALFPTAITEDFARAFNLRLINSVTAPWLEWFGVLLEYVKIHGDARVPVDYEMNGYKLGRWAVNQRARVSKLSEDQWNRLDELDGWSWNVNDEKWEHPFRLLLTYIKIHGHAAIGSTETFDDHPLGAWCAIQRRDGKSGKLLPERKARLDAIPEWVWSLEEARWEKGFHYAQEFSTEHGHLRIPQSRVTEDKFRVGAWLNFQRTRLRQGKLEPERADRLAQLAGSSEESSAVDAKQAPSDHADARVSPSEAKPPALRPDDWVSPLEAQWDRGCRYVEEFFRVHGHLRIPKGYEIDGVKVRDWMTNNRVKFDRLSPERQGRLSAIPGWDDYSHGKRWETGYGHALDYVRINGDASIGRAAVINGYPIGQWADVQRQARRKGALGQNRVDRLDVLEGWDWTPPKGVKAPTEKHDERWEEAFDHAQEFITANGHALIPAAYVTVDGFPLGRWVNRQRVAHQTGKLLAERLERLNAIGWVWKVR